MLETIYEVDEDVHREDSSKSTQQQSQFSVYMCWCMITGCFLILVFLILISLNPQYLLSNSVNKINRNIVNVPLDSKDKSDLSKKVIEYLGLFSHQINKQLGLQSNPIAFLTVPISNSSAFELMNPNGILWIYGHVKYPSSSINNPQDEESFHSKLKISFNELSNLIQTIVFNSSQHRQLQLNLCSLIENSTSATFISLVSIQTTEKNTTDSTIPFDPITCEDIDQHLQLTETIDDLISQNNSTLIEYNDKNSNIQKHTKKHRDSRQCTKYHEGQHQETAHCSNDISTPKLLMSNLF
ncbi:unnamed protein product [Adineta ricciae]|uniref:Uncharacterized protein n=1 Tax=Adineta ricciae TaxID=249248 RepID=A0A815H644_ADIRI|nr:unnamed protein product [Adineta ricciae]CAF1347919.1 unnamed protein product [Adineta ricciae]